MLGKLGPLPGQQIDWSSPFSQRLLAAYAFNEGAGTRLRCSVRPSQAGTISGATWVQTPYGPALDFAAGTNAVTCPQDGRLAGMRRLTVVMVLQLDGGGGGGFGRAVTLNDTTTYGILTDGGTASSLLGSTNGSNFSSGTAMGTAWRHVAITYDGSTRRIYFDGIQQASSVGALAINASTADLIIGNRTGLDRGWDGRIKQLLIYDREYTAGELARLAQDWWLPWEDRRFRYWFWADAGSSPISATVGLASTLALGPPVMSGTLASSVGLTSGLSLGGPTMGGSLAATVGLASTLNAGPPVMSGSLAASVGVGSTLAMGPPTASLGGAQINAVVGVGAGTVLGSPAMSGSLAATVGLVSSLVVGPPIVAGDVEGPTQVRTVLSPAGPASSVIVQAGPSSTTFGAA